jgi:hypothetical protein
MSQVNVLVIHIRADQAEEYERLLAEHELPRWREYRARGQVHPARACSARSSAPTSARRVAKYVIVVEVPSMAEHHAHDADPGFEAFDQVVDPLQPEPPLVYNGDLLHAVG